MIKVCHMTSAHGPEDVRIFHKECVSLARAGYDVYLVERGDSYEKNGVHIVGVGQPSGGRLSRMTSFAKKVYQAALALDADIYHFHDPELLPYGLKLKKAGKNVVFDSHEKYTEQISVKPYLPKCFARLISGLYGKYERRGLRQIDAVIFPCTIEGKNPFEGKCRRAEIISNAAILDEFFNRYDPHCPKQIRQICYVGGLSEARGITNNIKAAYQSDARLALAGKYIPRAYGESLEKMPEYECVRYLGTLDRDAVRDLMNESTLGLFTYRNFGQYLKLDVFGVKVYEYMSMALPVILSHSPYNDEMTRRYKFGICVDPENVNEIASAIRYLLDHPEEARQMGENGRRAVKEEFNWGVEEKKLLALYEEILSALPNRRTRT